MHICEVPLEDILRSSGLVADKDSIKEIEPDKPADVLKDVERITAAVKDGDVKVDKVSEKAKRRSVSLDKTAADADDKMKPKTSDEQIRRQRKRSRESRETKSRETNEKIVSAAATTLPVLSQTDSGPTGKELVSGKELLEKETVASKEHRRHRSRQSAEVRNVTAAQMGYPSVDSRLSCGSGVTYPAADDVTYGSEAVEDVIQRLLDNDELMDDPNQPFFTSRTTAGREGATVGSRDSRRSRDAWNKLGKSARSAGQMSEKSLRSFSGKKLPGSLDLLQKLRRNEESVDGTGQTHFTSPGVADTGLVSPGAWGKSGKSPRSGRSPRSVGAHASATLPGSVNQKSPGSTVNAEMSGQPSDAASDADNASGTETGGVSRGPRIKHVCRYASIALGKSVATFPPVTSSHLHLSALPSQEKERLLVDKSPGMY